MKVFLPRSGAHAVYNLALGAVLVLTLPVWLPWVLLSGKRRKNFLDRLGFRMDHVPPASGRERIWIHAVSVGETLSAGPMVRLLRRRLPDAEILMSAVTLTGRETAEKALGAETTARFYFPFDLPWISRKFLERVCPDVIVVLETEIWPNFLSECAGRRIPVVIVNGRMSERSLRGYKRMRFLFSGVLGCFSAITTQTEEDARRFRTLVDSPASITVTGNMKFDMAPPAGGFSPLQALMLREKKRGTRWIVAGSTHEGEEAAVLRALAGARKINESIKLLLAPRHPERFGPVEELCRREGWDITRKTRLSEDFDGELTPVILLDTMGDLSSAYAAADIAFVGGSLVPKGGHNVLEPALYGVPTLTGPYMDNFREVAEIFSDAGALGRVRDGGELSERLAEWAADPSRDAGMGRRAQELLDSFRGAAERNAVMIERELMRRRREKI